MTHLLREAGQARCRASSLAPIVVSLALVGCGGGGDENGEQAAPPPPPPAAAGGSVEVSLAELSTSGMTGKATLEDTPDGVRVVLELANAGDARLPAHIHEGKCPEPKAFPTWALPDVTEGKSETLLGTGLRGEPEPTVADLQANAYAINVHKSYAESDVYVACGDIPGG